MAVFTEVNNYVAKFFNLLHLKYDSQLVTTGLRGHLVINLQQSLVPWEDRGHHGHQVHHHHRRQTQHHHPHQNHSKKVKPSRIRRRQRRAKERADAEGMEAASASQITGKDAPPSSRASPCWPQHYQPKDLLSTAPSLAPPAQSDFQLCEGNSSPLASPALTTIVARVDSRVIPAVKATMCVKNSQDDTLEEVAEEATTSTPPAAGKADLPSPLTLTPAVSLPSVELTGQDHNPPIEKVVAEEATKVELVSERKIRKSKLPKRNLRGLQQLPNSSPISQTFPRPSRAMSTPVKESPLLDGAVETLRARHLGGAGQTVGGHPPSCSQTPSSPQTFQVPWQLCSADHVSCWAV